MTACTVASCRRRHHARGLCITHYARLRTRGAVDAPHGNRQHATCTLPDCEREHYGRGLCEMHLARLNRHGTTERPGHWRCPDGDRATPEHQAARRTPAYAAWRTAVFERDDYTCQGCGARGVQIHADHVLSWAKHPEHRLDVDNGRTLCVPCHMATPTWGRG